MTPTLQPCAFHTGPGRGGPLRHSPGRDAPRGQHSESACSSGHGTGWDSLPVTVPPGERVAVLADRGPAEASGCTRPRTCAGSGAGRRPPRCTRRAPGCPGGVPRVRPCASFAARACTCSCSDSLIRQAGSRRAAQQAPERVGAWWPCRRAFGLQAKHNPSAARDRRRSRTSVKVCTSMISACAGWRDRTMVSGFALRNRTA